MEELTKSLQTVLKSPVADDTGLQGKYDFTVTYAGGFGRDGPMASSLSSSPDSAAKPLPDIFSALQSDIGSGWSTGKYRCK